MMQPGSGTLQSVVTCVVDLSASAAVLSSVTPFEEFRTTVTVPFYNGSVTGHAVAFYNGTMFIPGEVNPFTGATVGQAPATPTITMPSPNMVTPATIYNQYNIPVGASATGLVQGVVELTDASQPRNGLNISDVGIYLATINSTATMNDLFIIGNNGIVSKFETTLDVELIMAMAPGAITYVYCISYGSGGTYAGYSDALIGFAATGASKSSGGNGPASVWSISYGGPEWTSDPATYEHANTLLGHLSDSGVTVLASSGDQGAWFYEVELDQFGNIYQQYLNFGANWPAASPYVVAVGATAYRARRTQTQGDADYVERVCSVAQGNIITSGGGISTYWDTPDFQAPFNSNAKLGVPDLATVGAWIMVVVNGQVQPLFGTSASSPIFGGMVTLLNAYRRRLNTNATLQAPLRQVPSLLYESMSRTSASVATFEDVIEGDNCAGEPVNPGLSNNYPVYSRNTCYAATLGWDAVSGLGTPNFYDLVTVMQSWNPAPLHLPTSPAPGGTTPIPPSASPSEL
jgi:tripeptidyl-peptidase-1